MGSGDCSSSASWILDYIEKPISTYLGWIPIFSGTPFGLDVFTAGTILAIMIIPTVASISKEVISAVPNSIREGAYSIGATKWEVIRHWVISYGRSGIFGAVILGLGRAVGETMAVSMLIGNATGPAAMPTSLFQTEPNHGFTHRQRFLGSHRFSCRLQLTSA